jgi:hypothetical protein
MVEIFTIGLSFVSIVILRSMIRSWFEDEVVRRSIAKTRTSPNKSRYSVCGYPQKPSMSSEPASLES